MSVGVGMFGSMVARSRPGSIRLKLSGRDGVAVGAGRAGPCAQEASTAL